MNQKPLRISWQPDSLIYLVLIVYCAIGVLLVTHYGISLDEELRYKYAESTLKAYETGVTTGLSDEKGPFYGMIALLGSGLLGKVFTSWRFIDGWHLMTYLSFVMGIFFFYRLCRRLIKPWPAFSATLLFSTQPLIWGHSFMNPKDIPFMAFFMGSVSMGLEMSDRIFPRKTESAAPNSSGMKSLHTGRGTAQFFQRKNDSIGLLKAEWKCASPGFRKWFFGLIALAVGLIISYPLMVVVVRWLVKIAYSASPSTWIGRVFSRIAARSAELPVVLYQNKGEALYSMLILGAEIGLIILLTGIALRIFPTFRNGLQKLGQQLMNLLGLDPASCAQTRKSWTAASRSQQFGMILPGLLLFGLVGTFERVYPLLRNPMPYFWLTLIGTIVLAAAAFSMARKIFSSDTGQASEWGIHAHLIIAGCFLGFASDIRTLGPASGLLVGAYCLIRGGKKAILYLLEYLGIGAAVTYLFWPNLWDSPIKNYVQSLAKAADFPWNNTVLFNGTIYPVRDLPPSYIATIFGAQITEPALFLFLVGIGIGVVFLWKRNGMGLDVLLLGTWFLVPIAGTILAHSEIYDNARQLLFVLPPVFILAGFGLQFLWDHLSRKWIFALLSLAVIGPGLYWNIQLHPYEYIYYNGLVGGERGAFRRFEMDYWGISYKEAVEHLNKITPPNSTVLGPYLAGKIYNRPDLKIVTDGTGYTGIEYIVVLSKRNWDISVYPKSKVVYTVDRHGAILCVIKQIQPGDPPN